MKRWAYKLGSGNEQEPMEPEQPEADHRKDRVMLHRSACRTQDPTRPPSGRASTSVAAAATANKMDISLCLLLCIIFRHTSLTECSSCASRLLARALRKALSSPVGAGSGVESELPMREVYYVEQGSDIL